MLYERVMDLASEDGKKEKVDAALRDVARENLRRLTGRADDQSGSP